MQGCSGILTCDADVCLAAFGGSSRAPGHALTPVILRAKQLLNLQPCYFYTGFSYYETCKRKEKNPVISFKRKERERNIEKEIGSSHKWQATSFFFPFFFNLSDALIFKRK